MTELLNTSEQEILMKIARETLEKSVRDEPLPKINLTTLPSALQKNGASFVTLTNNGRLRGCIGTLEANQPIAIDVQEHTVAAAFQDFRFPNIQPQELPLIQIEVSVLTPKTPLIYKNPDELINVLKPNIDGVVLQEGHRKATFLPQVWDTLQNPEEFLSHLCTKMGASKDLWREKPLTVFTYQVQIFTE